MPGLKLSLSFCLSLMNKKYFWREYLKYPVRSNDNLLHALSLIPKEERFDCLMKNLAGVANRYNLPQLLMHVPEINKMDFYRIYAASNH